MRPRYTYHCPYCRRTFNAIPPTIASCPHCSSVLSIDYEGAHLLREGVKPPPQGATTLGGAIVGAIIGGVLAGPGGALIGGLVGAGIGVSTEKRGE